MWFVHAQRRPAGDARRVGPGDFGRGLFAALALSLTAGLFISCSQVPDAAFSLSEFSPGVALATQRVDQVPWTLLVLRVARSNPHLAFESVHARGTSVGLSTLSEQVGSVNPARGTPLAGINADFYQMWGRPYAGDARGLQIADGELLGVATEGICFWIDASGRPQADEVVSQFRVTWPDGSTNIFGLNEEVRTNQVVLFTPSLGLSATGTTNACDLVLERHGDSPWLPLSLGRRVMARVREIRPAGNTPLAPDVMVLAVHEHLAWTVPGIETGAVLGLSFGVSPDLKGVRTAIGGGPVLVRNGKLQSLETPVGFGALPYEFRSMIERHPRTALGWNEDYIYLVQVDGRQKDHSVGMTLKELAVYMVKLGCKEVINFDGGGSSEMWCNGQVVNRPCDRQERDMANSLVLVRKGPVSRAGDRSGLSSKP